MGESWQVNELIVKEDKVTRERVDKLDELTSEQVDCEGSQNNRGTGDKGLLYMGWEGLEKSKRLIHFLQEEFSFYLLSLLTLQVITL